MLDDPDGRRLVCRRSARLRGRPLRPTRLVSRLFYPPEKASDAASHGAAHAPVLSRDDLPSEGFPSLAAVSTLRSATLHRSAVCDPPWPVPPRRWTVHFPRASRMVPLLRRASLPSGDVVSVDRPRPRGVHPLASPLLRPTLPPCSARSSLGLSSCQVVPRSGVCPPPWRSASTTGSRRLLALTSTPLMCSHSELRGAHR